MPAMATVDTMARSQNELLEAGRAKLAKFQSRNKGKKTGKKSSVSDAKVYANGSPSLQVSGDVHSDVVKSNELGKENVDRNGIEVDQPKEIQYEGDVNRNEQLVEEGRRHFVASELSERVEKYDEEKLQQWEVEERRRKDSEAEEAIRREAEEQRNQQVTMERLKKIKQEAEENRQRQREAEEAKRKERERQVAEEARKQAIIAEREVEEAKRKEEEAKRRDREAEQRRQLFIAEVARKKQLEADEIKRKDREAEEIRRKEREAEEAQRRQRDEEEFRRKQRDEFSSLEQHIQDLTEEKFGLQRELAKARAMTENFVLEHSLLVENFNDQVYHCSLWHRLLILLSRDSTFGLD